jgi:hypothetical protein
MWIQEVTSCLYFCRNPHAKMQMATLNWIVNHSIIFSINNEQNNSSSVCRNPSFGLTIKTKGLQGCGPRGNPGAKAKRPQGCGPKGSPGTKAKRPQRCKPRGSSRVTSHTPGNVRKCEGVNTHTPKVTPILGDRVPTDSWNFQEQFQRSKLNGLWKSLYHWKALGT